MVSIRDSLGAIANVTETVSVKSKFSKFPDNLNFLKQYYENNIEKNE